MKIPGVAEMVYSNTNPAFSKMAVLSENLDKLEEIYDFIFKYKDYVDVLLDEYVRKNHVALSDIDSLDNTKFKGLETTKLTVDGANYYGTITIGTIDNDNSVTGFKLSLYNNDDLMLGELKFGYDPIDERFYILIPNTYEDVSESAVNVAYLDKTKKAILDILKENIDKLIPRLDKLEADFNAHVDEFNRYKDFFDENLAALRARIDEFNKQIEDTLKKIQSVVSSSFIRTIQSRSAEASELREHFTQFIEKLYIPEKGKYLCTVSGLAKCGRRVPIPGNNIEILSFSGTYYLGNNDINADGSGRMDVGAIDESVNIRTGNLNKATGTWVSFFAHKLYDGPDGAGLSYSLKYLATSNNGDLD